MKELDKTIIYIEIFKSETLKIKNIQLIENFKIVETISTIICQTDHKNKDLEVNSKKS